MNTHNGIPKAPKEYPRGLLVLAKEIIEEYWKTSLINPNGNDQYMESFAVSRFSVENILSDFFRKKLYGDLCSAFFKCQKKVLIAIDACNEYNDYDVEELKQKYQTFDSILYTEAIISADMIQQNNRLTPGNGFTCCAKFCLLISSDKYVKINRCDLDSAKRPITPLYWTAQSLLEMIIKRLQYIYKKRYPNNIDEKIISLNNNLEKLSLLLNILYPSIPTKVTENLSNNARKEMHLFTYVLRHSFMRPRDIICHFAALIDFFKDISSDGLYSPFQMEYFVHQTVAASVKNRVLNNEFYGEYRDSFPLLESYLKKTFKNKDLIMNIQDFNDIIVASPLQYYGENISSKDTFQKLFLMGIIGFYFSNKFVDDGSYDTRSCFYFNAGSLPYTNYMNGDYDDCLSDVKICFNPVLIKDLRLNPAFPGDFICDYDENYIRNNHSHCITGIFGLKL